jgi:hypothetical protein
MGSALVLVPGLFEINKASPGVEGDLGVGFDTGLAVVFTFDNEVFMIFAGKDVDLVGDAVAFEFSVKLGVVTELDEDFGEVVFEGITGRAELEDGGFEVVAASSSRILMSEEEV